MCKLAADDVALADETNWDDFNDISAWGWTSSTAQASLTTTALDSIHGMLTAKGISRTGER
jgi:hypothetical protein